MASKEISYKSHTFTLSYEILNPSQNEVLLVLHGWGSNKEIMKQAFGKLLPHYRHLYLDLPGFGKSSNEMILTTEDYAAIVTLFLEAVGIKPKIAMGHSFGGKVATLLQTPCLVLLSSAGVITEKPWSVKLKIATVKSMSLWSLLVYTHVTVEGVKFDPSLKHFVPPAVANVTLTHSLLHPTRLAGVIRDPALSGAITIDLKGRHAVVTFSQLPANSPVKRYLKHRKGGWDYETNF